MTPSIIVPTLAGLLLLTAACGTTTGTSARVAQGGFDNARTVNIAPHGNAVKGMVGTAIGAQWSEAKKDQVILIVAVVNVYTGITGAELNIDGEKITLASTGTVTDMGAGGDIMKMSTQGYITKLETVEKIVRSKRTWLRVHTPTGTMEDAVIDGATDSKAYHALKRFLVAVNGK